MGLEAATSLHLGVCPAQPCTRPLSTAHTGRTLASYHCVHPTPPSANEEGNPGPSLSCAQLAHH